MQIKELLKEPKILSQIELESYSYGVVANLCRKIVTFKGDRAAGKFTMEKNYLKYLCT